jgi:hypothetical protein
MMCVFPYFLSIVHNFAGSLYRVNTEHLNTMTTQVLELLRIDPPCGRRNSLSHPPQFAVSYQTIHIWLKT